MDTKANKWTEKKKELVKEVAQLLSKNTPILDIVEHFNKTSVADMAAQIQDIVDTHSEIANELKLLPPFAIMGTGSVTRNEMAPYSDFDQLAFVENQTKEEQSKAIGAWRDKVKLLWVAYSHDPVVSNEAVTALAAGENTLRIAPDFRLVWSHGTSGEANKIIEEYEETRQAEAAVKRAHDMLIGKEPLGSRWVTLEWKMGKTVAPKEIIIKDAIYVLVYGMSQLACYKREKPSFNVSDFKSKTIARLHAYVPDKVSGVDCNALADAFAGLLHIRYQLHIKYEKEQDNATESDYLGEFFKIYPAYGANLKALCTWLQEGKFK